MHVLECHSLHFPDDTVLRFITMFLLVADKKKNRAIVISPKTIKYLQFWKYVQKYLGLWHIMDH